MRKCWSSAFIPNSQAQRIPGVEVDDQFWADRLADINALKRHLTRNGTVIVKFFLHISKGQQRKRFLKRLDDPRKQWKFSTRRYRRAGVLGRLTQGYEQAMDATSTEWAPWHIIPADADGSSRLGLAL